MRGQRRRMKCRQRDEYQIRSLCHVDTRAVTSGARAAGRGDGPPRKQMRGISARNGRLDQRNCCASGWPVAAARRAVRAVVLGFRGYWHIRNLLSASFPEIADLPARVFPSRSPATPGRLRILTWNSFAALRRDSSRKFTAFVVRAVTWTKRVRGRHRRERWRTLPVPLCCDCRFKVEERASSPPSIPGRRFLAGISGDVVSLYRVYPRI